MFKDALLPLVRDSRDYNLGSVFNLPKLEELPTKFFLSPVYDSDQQSTDYCAAAATAGASETQEGVPLSFEYQFAIIKELAGGDVNSYGSDLRTAMKAGEKVGFLTRSDAPYSLKNMNDAFLRRIENWPKEFKDKAREHKKASYFSVVGQYDHYDNIRAAIWKFKDEKCVPVLGVLWSWPVTQVIIDRLYPQGNGHAIRVIGWDERGLCLRNSAGVGAGENGYHFFSREVINHNVEIYGCFMYHDMPREKVEYYLETGTKADDNWLVQLMKSFINAFKPVKAPIVVPAPTPSPEPVKSLTNRERFYAMCLSSIDIDASPKDAAPDELGCADSVNQLYFKTFGRYIEAPGISTTKLCAAMLDQPQYFKRVYEPAPGRIIASPTGFSKIPSVPIKNGHIGVFGEDERIMSNSSQKATLGRFLFNYTLPSWARYFRDKGGYPIYIFDVL